MALEPTQQKVSRLGLSLKEIQKWCHHCPNLDSGQYILTCGPTVSCDDGVSATVDWDQDVDCPECLRHKPDTGLFTVVLELSHPTALKPGLPMRVFVHPAGNLSEQAYQEFRDAAERGGASIQIYTVKPSSPEDVTRELSLGSATKLD